MNSTGTCTFVYYDTPTLAIDTLFPYTTLFRSTTSFTFTVTKTGATTQSATVGFTTVDGTATGNSSCATAATGTPRSEERRVGQECTSRGTTKTIKVTVCADTTVELTETFTVKLSGTTGATITKDTGTGTIVNDDTATLVIDEVMTTYDSAQ